MEDGKLKGVVKSVKHDRPLETKGGVNICYQSKYDEKPNQTE